MVQAVGGTFLDKIPRKNSSSVSMGGGGEGEKCTPLKKKCRTRRLGEGEEGGEVSIKKRT